MKDSLAAALRHSREQAQSTYDRRKANQKKALAFELARRTTGEPDGEEQPSSDRDEDTTSPHKIGDFVGLVEEGSCLQQPRVLLGRLHAFLPGGRASLLWHKCAGAGLYCLEVDGSQWVKSLSSLVPVKVKPAKGKTNCYRLCTSLRTNYYFLYSFQLHNLENPCIVISCPYLPESGLGNFHVCCLP